MYLYHLGAALLHVVDRLRGFSEWIHTWGIVCCLLIQVFQVNTRRLQYLHRTYMARLNLVSEVDNNVEL